MAAFGPGLDPIEIDDLGSKVKVTVTGNIRKKIRKNSSMHTYESLSFGPRSPWDLFTFSIFSHTNHTSILYKNTTKNNFHIKNKNKNKNKKYTDSYISTSG